jgi:thymidylate kinase
MNMIIAVDCIDTEIARKAASMLADSIADQNAAVELVIFEHAVNLDDEDERPEFAAQFNQWVVWDLIPALRKPDTAVIVPTYVLTAMAKFNSISALNTIRAGVHPLYLPDIQIVIDVTADSVYAKFNEAVRSWYSLEELIRERDFITTFADNSPKVAMFEYTDGDDFFDFVEMLADYVWSTAPSLL